MGLQQVVNIVAYPILDRAFRDQCKTTLDQTGVLVLPDFLSSNAVAAIYKEGQEGHDKAYFCKQKHNVYLTEPNPNFPPNHPRNREVLSSKGCICDDVVAKESPLRQLYDSEEFRKFLCVVLSEKALYKYADTLSSINLHYAEPGQELGWHFDNSSFAITLMIKAPEQGGKFEYVRQVRNFEKGELNYKGVESVLDGRVPVQTLSLQPGALVLFRGRDSLHRVTPVEGLKTRILVVLAYNKDAGIALSRSARQTFFGRMC
jgi:hypothetical protein